eukprot:g318.t1
MTALRPAASAIREAFAEFDLDGSGYIDANEIRSCVYRKFDLRLSTKEARSLLSLYDNNGDGRLDVEEFGELVHNLHDVDPKNIVKSWAAQHGGALSDKLMMHLMKRDMLEEPAHTSPDDKVMLCNFPVDPKDYNPLVMSEEEFDARTAMSQALHRKDFAEVFRLVDETNADPDWEDAYGKTPLIEACRYGLRVVVNELFERGAEGDYESQYGETALSCAAKHGYGHCFDVLLFDKFGNTRCTAAYVNRHGKNASDYAAEKGFNNLLDALEEAELK